MDKNGFREKARDAIKAVRWIPEWGEERMESMVAGRPDWCISRQRSWGVPIPAFACRACGSVLADSGIVRHVADIFEKEGSNSWSLREAAALLPPGTKCPACGAKLLVERTTKKQGTVQSCLNPDCGFKEQVG